MTPLVHRYIGVHAVALAALVASCASPKQTPDQEPTVPAPCTLEISAAGDREYSLTLVLVNTGSSVATGSYMRPFLDFELEVWAGTKRLSLAQPALDIPVQPAQFTLQPGEQLRLAPPIKLRFAPDVAPSGGDDPYVWTIRSEPVEVSLVARPSITGLPACTAEATLDPR